MMPIGFWEPRYNEPGWGLSSLGQESYAPASKYCTCNCSPQGQTSRDNEISRIFATGCSSALAFKEDGHRAIVVDLDLHVPAEDAFFHL